MRIIIYIFVVLFWGCSVKNQLDTKYPIDFYNLEKEKILKLVQTFQAQKKITFIMNVSKNVISIGIKENQEDANYLFVKHNFRLTEKSKQTFLKNYGVDINPIFNEMRKANCKRISFQPKDSFSETPPIEIKFEYKKSFVYYKVFDHNLTKKELNWYQTHITLKKRGGVVDRHVIWYHR